MNRRAFLSAAASGTFGLGVLGPAVLARSLPGVPGVREDFAGWLWIGGRPEKSASEWRSLFSLLGDSGFRGVLVGRAFDPEMADAAHRAGLEYHRWMWILNRAGDTWARENHPEWFTVSRNGDSTLDTPPYVDYYRWVCPSRAPVREHLRRLISEASREPDLDGIHLDYIRYCDVILPRGLWDRYDLVQDRELPEFDFCYCEVCREQFEAQTGRDPLALEDPTADEEWARFRWDSVTRVVAELSETARASDKSISAAVFATPAEARRLVRQAWDEWPVDRLFPMLYHPAYGEDVPWIGRSVVEGVEALRGTGVELNAGLYVPALNPEELASAVRVVRRSGAAGFSLFDLNPLTEEHIRAVRSVLRETTDRFPALSPS
ncbi:MAG: hypothetical protein M8866_00185 [marine benthic group bacterium]|nr:hypothetical protein [Candidatus Benthicola marisminoris]